MVWRRSPPKRSHTTLDNSSPSRGGGHPAAGFIAARLASSEERGGGTGIRIRFRNGVMLEMDLSCAGAVGTELLTHLATLP